MLKSMTGYGRHEEIVDGRKIVVEIKSVNHKYFEFNFKVSRGYIFLEDKLKSYTQSRVSRGKVDMYVHIENLEDNSSEVIVNHALVSAYLDAYNEIKEKYGINTDVNLELLTKNSDVFSVHKKPEDEKTVYEAVLPVLEKAIISFIKMREIEGTKMFDDIMIRINNIVDITAEIEKRSPVTVAEYRNKLEARLKEILADKNIEKQRILTEAAIFADKVAVAEETVRLASHINQFKNFATSSKPIGRKMDFLVQEMNREINTIGSKANDSDIAYMVVDVKAEIEKIREQIQNIE